MKNKTNEFMTNIQYGYFIKDLETNEIYTQSYTSNRNNIIALISIYLDAIENYDLTSEQLKSGKYNTVKVEKIEYPIGDSNCNFLAIVTYKLNDLYKQKEFMILTSIDIDTMN